MWSHFLPRQALLLISASWVVRMTDMRATGAWLIPISIWKNILPRSLVFCERSNS
jgi:hypothetical protein